VSELNLLIRKRGVTPHDPEARRLYVEALKRQHEAGLLKAQIDRGEMPMSLMATLIPDLTGPQRFSAMMEA
jgi:hypothetical protein